MSATIKTWQERVHNPAGYGPAHTVAMQAEIDELREALNATVQAQGVALPSGWAIEGGAVDLVVKKPGVGGYWAERDSSNIASSILFHFASDMLAQAAPTSHALDAARAKGRAEALDILMGLDPDVGIDEYIGWSVSGAPEDEGSSHWNVDKLRELLHVDSALADMQDKAEAEHYTYLNLREEAERIHAAALLAHEGLRDQVGQAISDEIQRGAPEPDWLDSREIDRLADAAMLVLLMHSSYGQSERLKDAQLAARGDPVAEVRDGGLSGPAIVPLVLWERLPDGMKLYAAPMLPTTVPAMGGEP